jgi:hypothetical protein
MDFEMMPLRMFVCVLLAPIISLALTSSCLAQQHRYMDSSGNIHFVDNVYQIPQRYRQQVMTPTPVPVLDRKALAEKKRQEQQAKREKAAEDRRKALEERAKKREEAKRKVDEAKKNKREGQSSGFGRLM